MVKPVRGILRNKTPLATLLTRYDNSMAQTAFINNTTQTVSSALRILYNTARFPVAPNEARSGASKTRDFDDGNSAWFACSIGISYQQTAGPFSGRHLPVSDIYAEYVHFADLSAPLNADDEAQLQRLLKYGPSLAEHAPEDRFMLVTPRPGTISPWSSKATDIAHNCGLPQILVWSAAWHFTLRPRR